MTRCSASKCMHNRADACTANMPAIAEHVDDTGNYAYCSTFTKGEGVLISMDNSLSEFASAPKDTQTVLCSVSSCVNENSGACNAQSLNISNPDSPYDTVCKCASYSKR